MVVLQTYYEVFDRPSIEVNKSWKVCQIIIYIVASLSGLVSYIVFKNLEYLFEDNCIIFPTIIFTTVEVDTDTGEIIKTYAGNLDDVIGNNTNTTTRTVIDRSRTIWGNEESCNYYEYVPIMSFLIGIIFVTFFCMCPRGGSRQAQAGIRAPWNIVPLSLILTGIFSIIVFHSYVGVRKGVKAFCDQFKDQINQTECNQDIGNYSLREQHYYGQAFDYIIILYILYFTCFIAWVIAFFLLVTRSCCCVIDFKIMKMTISTLEDDDEESSKDDVTVASLKSGSINEIETEILVTETQELLTKPVAKQRKSLPHV